MLYVFFNVNFKIYSLSNFQIYITLLLSLVTMLYITSQNIYFITESLYCLTTFTHFPLPLASDNHRSDICFFKFSFYRFHLFVWSYSICLFSIRLISLSIRPLGYIHITNGKIFFLLQLSNIPLCMYATCYSSIRGHLSCFHVLVIEKKKNLLQ